MRAIRALERRLNGFGFSPKADPPSVVSNPWNSIVVTYGITFDSKVASSIITAHDIWKNLINQVGLSTNLTLAGYLKFQTVSVWGPTSQAIVLEVYNYSMSSSHPILTTLEDYEGKNHFPKAGYVIPKSLQNNPVFVNTTGDGNKNNICSITSTEQQATIVCHFHVLWKFKGTTGPNITQGLPKL